MTRKATAHQNDFEHLFRDIAPIYREAGLKPFPAKTDGSKQPAINGWQERAYNQSLWMAESFPDANVALLCGLKGGIVGVDVDDEFAVPFYLEEFGPTPLIFSTLRGAHFIYRYDPDRPCRTIHHPGGRKFDLQSDGHYIVVPPSTRPDGPDYGFMAGSFDTLALDVADLPTINKDAYQAYACAPRVRPIGSPTVRLTPQQRISLKAKPATQVILGERHSWLLLSGIAQMLMYGDRAELHAWMIASAEQMLPPFSEPENLMELEGILAWICLKYDARDLYSAREQSTSVSLSLMRNTPAGNPYKLLTYLMAKHKGLRKTFNIPRTWVGAEIGIKRHAVSNSIGTLISTGWLTQTSKGKAHELDEFTFGPEVAQYSQPGLGTKQQPDGSFTTPIQGTASFGVTGVISLDDFRADRGD